MADSGLVPLLEKVAQLQYFSIRSYGLELASI